MDIKSYKVSDLIVIKLDAGRDRNGNGRRCYILAHSLDGFLDATDDAGEGDRAVADFVRFNNTAAPEAERETIIRELMARITHKIDTSPSYYRGMVARKLTAHIEYDITL